MCQTIVERNRWVRRLLSRTLSAMGLWAGLWVGVTGVAGVESIPVPNGSFELPTTTFAYPLVDDWEKTPKPDWYDESQFPWYQTSGVFLNTTNGSPDHIDNMDGSQALFLFALPTAGIFQDYDSIGGTNTAPSRAFDALYEPGKTYRITVGVIGGGGGMPEGSSLQIGLYYRDRVTNWVNVASTNVVFSTNAFPNTTHFTDVSVQTPWIASTDPAAGQHIGIQLVSTVAPTLVGGYWDLDNVRLAAEALALTASPDGSNLQLGWPSLAGYSYQVRRSEDLATWADYGEPLAGTGEPLSLAVPLADPGRSMFTVVATRVP